VPGSQSFERVLDGAFIRFDSSAEDPRFPTAMGMIDERHHYYFDVRPGSPAAERPGAPHGVPVHDDARLERLRLEEVELDPFEIVVEEGPAAPEDHGVDVEQELVEQPGAQETGRECRAAGADVALDLVADAGELLHAPRRPTR